MRARTVACVVGALAIGPVLSAAGQSSPRDYPQWRGQNRDGEASAFTAPKSWPDTLCSPMESGHWRRLRDAAGGCGHRLLLHPPRWRGGDDGTRCCDGQGAVAHELPCSLHAERPGRCSRGGPRRQHRHLYGRLFTLGISGILAAFDAALWKILWKTDAPSEAPFFSAASSPVVEGGVVMVHPGNYGPLTAYDVRTGQSGSTAGEDGFFASPLVATLAGARQVITVTQSSVIGISIADGAVLWRYPWPGGEGGTMPVLHGDTVIVGALNAGAAAFTPRSRDGKWTAEPLWTTKEVSLYLSNPVVTEPPPRADREDPFSRLQPMFTNS